MKYIWLILLFIYLFIDNTFASCVFWLCNVDPELQTWWDKNMEESIKSLLNYFLWFIAFIWVVFVIKWGFQILTAAWDDEKVKSWKKTLLYSLLGIFLIFMSWSIIDSVFVAWETISK
jgi:hypothetical protein